MKTCEGCEQQKELQEFLRQPGSNDRKTPGRYCCDCLLVRRRASAKLHRTNHVEYHNISIEDYYRLLESQHGGCAICGTTDPGDSRKRHFQVDHDHTCCSGRPACGRCVRGLLCGKCNKMLGAVADKAAVLVAGARYLTEWSHRQ